MVSQIVAVQLPCEADCQRTFPKPSAAAGMQEEHRGLPRRSGYATVLILHPAFHHINTFIFPLIHQQVLGQHHRPCVCDPHYPRKMFLTFITTHPSIHLFAVGFYVELKPPSCRSNTDTPHRCIWLGGVLTGCSHTLEKSLIVFKANYMLQLYSLRCLFTWFCDLQKHKNW